MNQTRRSAAVGRSLAKSLLTAMALLASLACEGEPAVVPVRFIDGLPVVSIKLGDASADFLVDTGGQIGITIPKALITEAAGVSLRDEFAKQVDAAGHVASVQRLTARSVMLGGVDLGPVDGLVHYKWGLSVGNEGAPGVTQKGTIGFKSLSAKNVLLDFPHGSILLFERHTADHPDVSGWRKVPFAYDRRGVVVTVRVDGTDTALTLDSAATSSMIKKDAALFASHASPCAGQDAGTPFCGFVRLAMTQDTQDLGSIRFAVVKTGELPFDGILGSDFLDMHTVYIDFDNSRMYVRTEGR